MKKYELTILTNDELNQEEASQKVEKIIEQFATITKKEDVGRKRLAYPIMNREYANYYYYEIEAEDNNKATGLSRALNITEEVLRYLLVAMGA